MRTTLNVHPYDRTVASHVKEQSINTDYNVMKTLSWVREPDKWPSDRRPRAYGMSGVSGVRSQQWVPGTG